jgi:hypothetical protein
MEITCTRCNQTVLEENCYCPVCGLPQLTYTADAPAGPGQPERWNEAVRDAGSVYWKPALRSALMLAVPAGLVCSFLGIMGLLLMSISGAWAVSLYMRSQRPAWITIGAGARIGLACGLIAGWLAFAASGGALFVDRYGLHRAAQIDQEWRAFVDLDSQMTQKIAAWIGPADPAEMQALRTQTETSMLSPEGHAGMVAANFAWVSLLVVVFATLGGALGARVMARSRRPEV